MPDFQVYQPLFSFLLYDDMFIQNSGITNLAKKSTFETKLSVTSFRLFHRRTINKYIDTLKKTIKLKIHVKCKYIINKGANLQGVCKCGNQKQYRPSKSLRRYH